MKKYLKAFGLFIFSALCLSFANSQITSPIIKSIVSSLDTGETIAPVKYDTTKGKPYHCVATMYYPVASQCDADPLVTAGMYVIPKNASEQHWIALSRDMLSRWGGEFHYGDYVQITGAGKKDGIYKVVDTMNKRFKHHIDFLESKGTEGYKFNHVTLTKIEWKAQTPTTSLLASL